MSVKFRILVSDDLNFASLRVEDDDYFNSLVHMQFEKDIIKELYNQYKIKKPSIIEFGSENYITAQLRKLINEDGYGIDGKGNLVENKVIYNKLEKDVEEMLDQYEIKVTQEYNFNKLFDILLYEGYELEVKKEDGNFYISIKK